MDDSDDDYVDDYLPPSGAAPRRRTPRRVARGDADGDDAAASVAGAYSWEDAYHRSWDAVQEDSGGSLAGAIAGMVEQTKRARIPRDTRPVQRGIIRNLVLVLDLSSAMSDSDMRPTRHRTTLDYAQEFVGEYFSQNPISQLAIVGMSDGLAQLISPLDGNPHRHLEALAGLRNMDPSGVPSLQNALEMARTALFHVPQHCTREVLLVFGALISSDPGDINKTINTLVADKIRVRIIGLAAQVAVCQQICRRTNFGDTTAYNVVLNEQHFRQLMLDITVPLSINKTTARHASTLVLMGFPSRTSQNEDPVLCACHGRLVRRGYNCPRCRARVCQLPMVCPVCQLTLILSTHLARSYHHLFPLQNFKQVESDEAEKCFACRIELELSKHRYECRNCHQRFCVDCDVFCHETLHNCPGCEAATIKA